MTERIADPADRRSPEAAAIADLGFIRATMERATTFTAVPGRGAMAMGLVALATSVRTWSEPVSPLWLQLWLFTALIASLIGLFAMQRKAHTSGGTLRSAAGTRFALAFGPALVAGMVLTVVLWRTPGAAALVPGVWLLCYGVAVMAAGTHSVRLVPLMGLGFLLLGAVALVQPTIAPWALALGFGGLHLVGGYSIARHHGG